MTCGRTEVERRSKYFEKIDRSRSNVLIPLIESCLSNLPKNRPSTVRACDQLEDQLNNKECVSVNELTVSALQQEIQQKNVELQKKDNEIQQKDVEIQSKNTEIQHLITALHDKDVMLETMKSDLSKLQVTTSHLPSKQVQLINYIIISYL